MAAVPASPIVGRQRERKRLHACLADALAGDGRLVLISGEAGIGKTRVVEDLVDQARDRGALVLSGGCYDLTATPPYGPWLEAVRRYSPHERDPVQPSWLSNPAQMANIGAQAELFEEAARFFAAVATQQTLVIVLEDLHWSDPASLDALHYLARSLSETPILLVVTYRDDELTRGQPLFQLLPALVRETRAERVRLGRLDDREIQTLISGAYALSDDDLLRLTAHVAGLAEGNPLFTVELLRALEDEGVIRVEARQTGIGDLTSVAVPPLIQQVIERRLERLDEKTRDALQVAAVIGHELSIEPWRAVSGLTGEALDHVVDAVLAAHVLEELPDHTAFRFTHALVREVLYSGIVLPRRRRHHRAIAELLAASSRSDPDAIAHHYQQAGDARALAWLLRAGLRARQSAAWITAAERFDQAAAMLAGDPSRLRERGRLVHQIGIIQLYTNNQVLLSAYMEEAERLASAAGDEELIAVIRMQRGVFSCHRGDIRQGLNDLEQALAAFAAHGLPHTIGSPEEHLPALIRSLIPDAGIELDPLIAAPAPKPDRQTDIDTRLGILVNWLSIAGRYREALEIGEPMIAEVRRAGGDGHENNTRVASGYGGLALSYAALGRSADARRAYARACGGFEAISDYFAASLFSLEESGSVVVAYETDDLVARVHFATRSARLWEGAQNMTAAANLEDNPITIFLNLLEGDWDTIAQFAALEHPIRNPLLRSAVTICYGIVARDRGDDALAWQQVQALLPNGPATEPGDCVFQQATAGQWLAVELALDDGDLETARAWLAAHERWLEWSGAVLGRSQAALLWARYHLAAGEAEQARRHATRALAYASDPRQPLALIATYRLLGQIDARERRFVEADRRLHESLFLAEACAALYEQALTLLGLAELGAVTGDADAAWQHLNRVRAICTPLGAIPALQRAAAIAAKLAVRRGQPAHPAGLTPRELDVLGLVAQGLTDAEVAEQLFISPRTIGVHLSSVYNKLGVNSRVEATRFAVEQGLVGSPPA